MEARKDQVDTLANEAKTDPAIMPALWEAVERFIEWQSRRRYSLVGNFGGCEIEDLTQSGYLALVAAVQDYDPEKGSFLTILALHLKTAFAEAAGIRSTRGMRFYMRIRSTGRYQRKTRTGKRCSTSRACRMPD